jgi:lambda family phage portal protein
MPGRGLDRSWRAIAARPTLIERIGRATLFGLSGVRSMLGDPAEGLRGVADGVGLEAGRMGRRLRGWIPTRVHINSLISQSGLTTLARARFLARNNGYATSAVECFASNLVGPGILLNWKSPIEDLDKSAKQKKDVQDLWERFVSQADAEGVNDFYGLQRRVAAELFVAGECFVRKRPRRISDKLAVPLQLQLLPSEMLPVWLTMPLDNGNVIRQGIEFDKIGRRVAYHFWKAHPGDQTVVPKWGERVRIPASEILHIFAPMEAGQIRGLSRLTPAIISLWMLDLYDDAELDRKKTAALFSLFIKRPDPDGEFFAAEQQKQAKAGADSTVADVKLEPGSAQVLMPGEEIQVAAPADSGHSYDPFQYRTLTRICAGLGLPYAGVTGDILKANYSNMRAALIEARRRAEVLQHGTMIFQLCVPVVYWFLDAAHVGGALALEGYAEDPAPWRNVEHIPPKWLWIDPLKDIQAEVIAVNGGFKARSMVVEETGNDPVEVDRRIAEDKARADKLGLQFAGSQTVRNEVAEEPTQDANAPAPETPPSAPAPSYVNPK